jgi:hypothetical protein
MLEQRDSLGGLIGGYLEKGDRVSFERDESYTGVVAYRFDHKRLGLYYVVAVGAEELSSEVRHSGWLVTRNDSPVERYALTGCWITSDPETEQDFPFKLTWVASRDIERVG